MDTLGFMLLGWIAGCLILFVLFKMDNRRVKKTMQIETMPGRWMSESPGAEFPLTVGTFDPEASATFNLEMTPGANVRFDIIREVDPYCPNCGDDWKGFIQEKHGTCWGCGGKIETNPNRKPIGILSADELLAKQFDFARKTMQLMSYQQE